MATETTSISPSLEDRVGELENRLYGNGLVTEVREVRAIIGEVRDYARNAQRWLMGATAAMIGTLIATNLLN